MPRRNLFTGAYPRRLKILGAVSLAALSSAVGVMLLGFATAGPVNDMNLIFLPIFFFGLLLNFFVLRSKERIDRRATASAGLAPFPR